MENLKGKGGKKAKSDRGERESVNVVISPEAAVSNHPTKLELPRAWKP